MVMVQLHCFSADAPHPTAAVLCMVSGDIAELLRGARTPQVHPGQCPSGPKSNHSQAPTLQGSFAGAKFCSL